MASSEYVEIRGLNETIRALQKIDVGFRRRLQREIRVLARTVQAATKEYAAKAGFDPPGQSGRGKGALIRNIRYSVRGTSALIRETAVRDGKFRYPAVFEYGHSHWGHRPFLEPTRKAMYEVVYRDIDRILREQLATFH